jgi:hypothetical protein
MATTYTLIDSEVLTGSQASVTFSAIPATFTDLVVRMSVRTDYSVVSFDNLKMNINSDTSSLYSGIVLRGNGSSASSTNVTPLGDARLLTAADGANVTADTFSNNEIYIPNYLSTTSKPFNSFIVSEDDSSTAHINTTAGLYRNSIAITSIAFISASASNFVSGSSFYLYGISSS